MGLAIHRNRISPCRIRGNLDDRAKGAGSLHRLLSHFSHPDDFVSISVFWLSPAEHLLCKGLSLVTLQPATGRDLSLEIYRFRSNCIAERHCDDGLYFEFDSWDPLQE